MKFTIAYYLVLLYLTVMLKPLIPIISDAWSHEFNGLEHISLVHAKYGNKHLQSELAETASDKESNKKQGTVKSGEEVPLYIAQAVCKYDFLSYVKETKFLIFYFDRILAVVIANPAPPPKIS